MQGDEIFREDLAGAAHPIPVRGLGATMSLAFEYLRDAARQPNGVVAQLIEQGAPPQFWPAVAWVFLSGDILAGHLQLGDRVLDAGAKPDGDPERNAALPDVAFWAARHAEAWANLAEVASTWCAAAEGDAESFDKAVREVRGGRATIEDDGEVYVVRVKKAGGGAG
jgi:hypothetical protein